MTPKVIDIYHGNDIRNFELLKEVGVIGVIHKCTQGAGYADPLYEARRKMASDAGLLWGAYSFNTGEDVEDQVDQFLTHANPDDTTLVALDFEDNPHSQMTLDQARAWLQACADKLGRQPVIYSGNRVKDLLGDTVDSFLGSHRLWLPQYGPQPRVQKSWTKQWLWQYSERGRLAGTGGFIDLNAYDGTDDQLIAEWAA